VTRPRSCGDLGGIQPCGRKEGRGEVNVSPGAVYVKDGDSEVKVGFSGITIQDRNSRLKISVWKEKGMKRVGSFIYTLICLATAMIGHTIHGSLFWAVLDFIFMPLTWCKWLICQQVTLTIIKKTFSFFMQ
jgi:hypothetical protein